jgi:hypothetical protein
VAQGEDPEFKPQYHKKTKQNKTIRQAWWFTPAVPALRRKEDHELLASVGYIVRPCLKKTNPPKKILI